MNEILLSLGKDVGEKMLQEYIKENILLADGAMGTYFNEITQGSSTVSEWGNLTEPELIRSIHEEYIKAGAKLVRTNTFSANCETLNIKKDELKDLIQEGYRIAKKAVGDRQVWIGADIGPIPEFKETQKKEFITPLEEYEYIIDLFLQEGAEVFVFETFSEAKYFPEISEYIKAKKPDAFIIVQFIIEYNGRTRKGVKADRIIEEAKSIKYLDAVGFNCGTGPLHMVRLFKKLDLGKEKYITALPNAGYPQIINERTVYPGNPEYFSDVMMDIEQLGAGIIGGCCGTTPLHIQKMKEKLHQNQKLQIISKKEEKKRVEELLPKQTSFIEKLNKNEFVTLVELDPPSDVQMDKIINGARAFKQCKVDLITVADSPLARVKVDSVAAASKIRLETGIEVLPHICCRDYNIIGLKARLMGCHIGGIRNFFAITGDPIPSASRSEIKSVFNLNSINLMKMVQEMNQDIFLQAPMYYGGALDFNVPNIEAQIRRMEKKIEAGASFFLTQPIYEDEALERLKTVRKKYDVKIVGGIMPLVNYRNANFLNNEVAGIKIPDHVIGRFSEDMSKDEAEGIGIQIGVEMAKKIRPYVDGHYFITPFYRARMIQQIIEEVREEKEV